MMKKAVSFRPDSSISSSLSPRIFAMFPDKPELSRRCSRISATTSVMSRWRSGRRKARRAERDREAVRGDAGHGRALEARVVPLCTGRAARRFRRRSTAASRKAHVASERAAAQQKIDCLAAEVQQKLRRSGRNTSAKRTAAMPAGSLRRSWTGQAAVCSTSRKADAQAENEALEIKREALRLEHLGENGPELGRGRLPSTPSARRRSRCAAHMSR